ncbi:Periplasmic serine endoprotease DegP-like [Candidatus Xenohaliotis californiensis]|uniref:Probable periplasmic serine endoprotease DegP-like n=1 Tax=Candidatus Xenohaliotis californiensis TaxID=84677 RepID=A0ABP0EUF0_9RICK|nr:Periplasmic serine endoprotease DegP-like [Candidatus Xenohaliotis californiensis]
MTKRFLLFSIKALFFLYVGMADARFLSDDSFAEVVEKVYDGVVNISTSHKVKKGVQNDDGFFRDFEELFEKFFNIDPRKEREFSDKTVSALGSGFIVDENGTVVTNYHVIQGASEITVRFNDDSTAKAEILGYDKNTDIAVLKVKTKKKLTKISFGSSAKLRIGDWVLAIGNPFGFGGSVSSGIVSAVARDVNISPFDDFIQTDAAINRGNSGGPLINMLGEVIGINTLIISNTGSNAGLGFAIPSSVASYVVQKIIEDGSVHRAWLGVLLQPVTDDIAKYYGHNKAKGALVAEVMKDSPADKAGMKVGDLILGFNGKNVDNVRDLPKMVGYTKVGSNAVLKVVRAGKDVELTVKVEKRPDNDESEELMVNERKDKHSKMSSKLIPGLSFQNVGMLSSDVKRAYKIQDAKGVFISKVDSDSSAYAKGIRQGMVITAANQQEILDIVDLQKQVDISKKMKKPVLVLVNSFIKGYSRFVAIPIE